MLVKNNRILYLKGLMVVFFLGLAGCIADETVPPIAVTKTAELIQYSTPTPSQTPDIKLPSLNSPTQLPTPTPTPVVYTIIEGDTMLAIALRHRISLEELQSANPDVNARLLVVGTELIIPLGESIPSNPVTATPIPIKINSTHCYPTPDGIWCFVSIKNDRTRALENISARVILREESGEFLSEGTAIGAINMLPVGEELPLIVFIPGRFPSEVIATATLLTVQPVPRNDDRYINAWLEVDEIEISQEGMQAEVAGKIGLPVKSQPGNLSWILVIAYDGDGNVVGVRKTEQFGLFEPGSSQEFKINVFSLESAISEVRAFVEVRP